LELSNLENAVIHFEEGDVSDLARFESAARERLKKLQWLHLTIGESYVDWIPSAGPIGELQRHP
jgi:hypothetical protein